MIVEINLYLRTEKLIIDVSQIVTVELYSELQSISSKTDSSVSHFGVNICFKNNRERKIWYNKNEEKAQDTYTKIKEALNNYHSRDIIGVQIRDYLQKLNKV